MDSVWVECAWLQDHRIPDSFVTAVRWQQAVIPDRHTVAELETLAEQLSAALNINLQRGIVWKELWIRFMKVVVEAKLERIN